MDWCEKKSPSRCCAMRGAEEQAPFWVLFGRGAAPAFEAVAISRCVNYLGRSGLSVSVAGGCFEEELCFPSLSLSFSSWQHEAAAAPVAEAVPSVAPPLPLPAAAAVAALLTTAVPPFRGPPPLVGPSPPAKETQTHSVVLGNAHFRKCILVRSI